LLDRRADDPAGAAAGRDLEPGDLPHAEADVPGPEPARAAHPRRLPVLHPGIHHDPATGVREGLCGRTAAPAQELGDEMSPVASLAAAALAATMAALAAPAVAGEGAHRQAVRADRSEERTSELQSR